MPQAELLRLQKQAERDIQRALRKRREHYHFARGLGFNYAEARRLSGASKEKITRLAQMRKAETPK